MQIFVNKNNIIVVIIKIYKDNKSNYISIYNI